MADPLISEDSMPEMTAHQRRLYRLVRADLVDAAASIAGFEFRRAEFGSAANISGIRSKHRRFSRRHDSRTLFATDARYGQLRELGAWTGADRTAVAACRRVLRAAKIPPREIETIDVLAEYGQVAEGVSDEEPQLHEPAVIRKLARARRTVNGVAVWSSYASVGLTAGGDVGTVEVHWPELTLATLKEAEILGALVRRRYEPPELPGARPESTEAGVIHSPAIGFFMDITAAVRVVYVGEDPNVGRKATLYLDRHGEPVARPRDIELAKPDTSGRPRPEETGTPNQA
jgi:hypothetical protein